MEFLAKVVDELAGRNIDFSNYVIITPNRRAGLFLKKYIQKNEKIPKPCWIPELYSIRDFISIVSHVYLIDNLSLVFRLYPIYRNCFDNPKSFDQFYEWGKMVISDFNEIDLYLIDQNKLFTSLRQISSVDEEFDRGGTVIKGFIKFSENLQQLYTVFTAELLEDKQAYYGLALRKIIDQFDISWFVQWDKVIFAGFNALSDAEQTLMEKLQEKGKAEIFWDIDTYFYEDETQEAGYFFRKNPLVNNNTKVTWITDELLHSAKKIDIIGVPGRTAQAKVAGEFLKKEISQQNDTAIVLPDESLLFPLLNSLPEDLLQVNVTMGYPLKNTGIYHLLTSVIDLQSNKESSDNGITFFFRDVRNILLHSYVLAMDRITVNQFLKECLEENRVVINEQELKIFTHNINYMFTPILSFSSFIEYIKTILQNIVTSIKDKEGFSLEIEYIYHFYTQLQKMEDTIAEFDLELELKTFWNLFKSVVEGTSIPFLGEPLQGLQIMGFLETRALDFSNVYILSANEGILPASRSKNSFIPYDVRKYFGMVTYEHEDSIYAYYFYRLLKKADTVKIFYNTESDEFGKGEKSRFIEQLLREYTSKNKNAEVRETIFNINTRYSKPEALMIRKDDEILEKLTAMKYSPTRLQTYVNCSLKFYLKYILVLEEREEVIESADNRVFGVIIHKTLEKLYRPLVGEIISENHLKNLKEQYEMLCEQVYQESLGNVDIGKGRNYIYCNIIKSLISRYLDNEVSGKTIISIEEQLERNITVNKKTIQLYGKIDRIEKYAGFTNIIDFKTGTINSLQFKFKNDYNNTYLFDKLQKNEQVLQLICYYFLVAGSGYISSDTRCRLGIYSFRNQQKKEHIEYLKQGRNKDYLFKGKTEIGKSISVLKHIIADILDTEVPFQQTENRDKCEYCPYKNICGR
ncbi:MAG: PD-(D/E)XK nuclease family protein [bacterium]